MTILNCLGTNNKKKNMCLLSEMHFSLPSIFHPQLVESHVVGPVETRDDDGTGLERLFAIKKLK